MKYLFKKSLIGVGFIFYSIVTHATEISGDLTIYTSQPPEQAQKTIDTFKEKYPNVNVTWTRNGTSQLMNILQTELMSGEIKADVLLVADDLNLGILKNDGLLFAYTDAKLENIDQKFYDIDKTYFGTKIISTAVGYNTNNATPITSWFDLTHDSNSTQVTIPSPLYSGAALYNLHALVNSNDLGWDFFKQLSSNKVQSQGGNGNVIKEILNGTKKYGMSTDSMIIKAKQEGSPIDIIYPVEGVSFVTEPVAILANSKNIPASKAFVDFLISKEGQEFISSQGDRPIMNGVTAPEGFPSIDKIKLLSIDVNNAIQNNQEYLEKFNDIFEN